MRGEIVTTSSATEGHRKADPGALTYADQAAAQLSRAADPIAATLWQVEFRHYRPLIERIIVQTERRVLHGETVAANEKIVSLFGPHAAKAISRPAAIIPPNSQPSTQSERIPL